MYDYISTQNFIIPFESPFFISAAINICKNNIVSAKYLLKKTSSPKKKNKRPHKV